MYTPKALPALPRKTCPARDLAYGKGSAIVAQACKNAPGSSGFCQKHSHIHELLNLLDEIDYPELQINPALTVGSGCATWEGYLLTVPSPKDQGLFQSRRYFEIVAAISAKKAIVAPKSRKIPA